MIESNNILKIPSYDVIYGLREAWERLSYLSYKLEIIDEVDEDVVTCKVIQVIHELIRR